MGILHVGVDVAKDTFASAVWLNGTGSSLGVLPNDDQGFGQLAQVLQQLCQEQGTPSIHLSVEATGGYELRLAYFAHSQGWEVSIVNAKRVRDWAKGVGKRAKTDKLDALVLARYGTECHPRVWHPLPEAVSELESLLGRKRELEKMLQQEANRQHSLGQKPKLAKAVPESVKLIVETLKRAIKQIDEAVEELLKCYPPMQEDAKALDEIPGVGKKTVLPLLVLMQRWDHLTQGEGSGKELTAYVGLDPQTRESGQSIRGRALISKIGDPQIRRALFMAALGGVRGKNALRDFYKSLTGRGKPKMVALIAAARKILSWAWAVYHSRLRFDPCRVVPVFAA